MEKRQNKRINERWINMSENREINREIGWSIVLSVLMIVAGALAIIVPPISGITVTILVGWLLVLRGATHLVYAWNTRRSGGLLWEILLSIIYIAAGGYLLLHPVAGLASLTVVLAVYLLLESVLEFILSFQLRPLPGSGWLLAVGIITLILAIMIWWAWPASTLWVIGTLVGVSMVFSGVARLMISLAARRVAKSLSTGNS
jgi:uncharacterized membrane protein HdeD (DUF308 family)